MNSFFKSFFKISLILCLLSNNSFARFYPAPSGGGGSPGGSNGQIQFNDSGSFGGDSGFTTDGSGGLLLTNGVLSFDGTTADIDSVTGGFTFTDDDNSSANVPAFHFKAGSRVGITPSLVTVHSAVIFDFTGKSAGFSAGTQGIAATVFVDGLSYNGTAPGTTFLGVANFGAAFPEQGSNASIETAIAGAFGNLEGYKASSSNTMTIGSIVAGIANGTGSVEGRRGLNIYTSPFASGLDLGNQTATLGALEGVVVDDLSPFSTTNTRTIDLFAVFHAKEQSIGSNVAVTEGPYGFYAQSDISSKNDVRFEGLVTSSVSTIASASNITALRPFNQVTGTTTINTMTAPINNLSAVVILHFTNSVTVQHNTAGSGASFQLAGSAPFAATSGDTLMVVFDGTFYREVSRTVI